MATKPAPNSKSSSAPEPAPLYEAFPEPRAWAQQWDGGALVALSNTQTKTKQQPSS